MSKNLFTIPEGPAGLTLSFLDGVESLVFIIMYKILNKVAEFISRDYIISIWKPHILDVFSKHKDINRLEIDPFDSGEWDIGKYSHIESLKSRFYSRSLDQYLPTLVNLKKLSFSSLNRVGYDLLSFFPHLEKLSASLCYKTNAITRMTLTKYKGSFYQSGSNVIDLNELFDTEKLEKLNVDDTMGMKLISLEGFTNLKSLILEEVFVDDYSFLSNLTKLEKIRLQNGGTPVTFGQISHLTNLKHLSLTELSLLDDSKNSTKMLNNLEYLNIDTFTDADPDSMRTFFSQLINLKELRLSEFRGSYLRFIPNGLLILRAGGNSYFNMSSIQHLTSLERLILFSDGGIVKSDMKYINRLKNLKQLLISTVKLLPVSLYDISGLTNLRRLDFHGSHGFNSYHIKKYLGHIVGLKFFDNQIEIPIHQ